MKNYPAELAAVSQVETDNISENLDRQFFAIEAQTRLDRFVSDNGLENQTLENQAAQLKSYLEEVVNDLAEKQAFGGDSQDEKSDRRILRLLPDLISKRLMALHVINNLGRLESESQNYLINK